MGDVLQFPGQPPALVGEPISLWPDPTELLEARRDELMTGLRIKHRIITVKTPVLPHVLDREVIGELTPLRMHHDALDDEGESYVVWSPMYPIRNETGEHIAWQCDGCGHECEA